MPTDPDHFRHVAAIRRFNRFYTVRLGLLARRHLDGDFSLTEARLLYEIGSQPGITASALCRLLRLDAGYLSRLLALLARRRLLRQRKSPSDGRERQLSLTPAGQNAITRLDEQSSLQIRKLLAVLPHPDREILAEALAKAQSILEASEPPVIRIVRLSHPGAEALDLLREYYEAVNVVRRDTPEAIRDLARDADSGLWLAYLNDSAVGCVILRPLASIHGAAECKRLYVQPRARGRRIADRLLDAMESFAQDRRFASIYLDSYDDLKAAIALYERRGYVRCPRYNDNPQATVFLRKRLT